MTDSSKRWLRRHVSDPYVKKAVQEGYPSRAAYKLLEINEKFRFLKSAMNVVDLGSAPGGWSKAAKEIVGYKGKVFALDILPMDELTGVHFIQGDFNDEQILKEFTSAIENLPIHVVLSDMAPNLSGHKSIDQPRAMQLVELAWDLAKQVLAPGGSFLTKVFQGEGVEQLVKELKKHFKQVKYVKPNASRSESSEIYLLALNFISADLNNTDSKNF